MMPLDVSLNSAKRAIISEILGNVEDVIMISPKAVMRPSSTFYSRYIWPKELMDST